MPHPWRGCLRLTLGIWGVGIRFSVATQSKVLTQRKSNKDRFSKALPSDGRSRHISADGRRPCEGAGRCQAFCFFFFSLRGCGWIMPPGMRLEVLFEENKETRGNGPEARARADGCHAPALLWSVGMRLLVKEMQSSASPFGRNLWFCVWCLGVLTRMVYGSWCLVSGFWFSI